MFKESIIRFLKLHQAATTLALLSSAFSLNACTSTQSQLAALAGATLTTATPAVTTSGPPDKIQIFSGNSQSNTKNTTLSNPISVRVTDSSGNPVSGVLVTFAPGTGGGSIITGALSITDSGGLASSIVAFGNSVGIQTFTATMPSGTITTVSFSELASNNSALVPSVGSDQIVNGTEDSPTNFTLNLGSDPQNFTLAYIDVTTPVSGGTLTNCMNLAGSTGSGDVSCTFTPNAYWHGTTSFSYKVNNGTYDSGTSATVTILYAAVNHAPVLKTIANQTITAGTSITSIDEDTNQNSDKDADGDSIAYSCTFAGGGYPAGTSCTSLPGTFSLNATNGQIQWSSSYGAAVGNVQTVYTFAITGSDQQSTPLTNTVNFTVTVTPAPPVLTTIASRLYPSSNLLQGNSYSFDANNIRAGSPGTDTNMSYSCTYDQVVDGAVNTGTACTSLPGVASFTASTGVLNWTPGAAAIGDYEIKIHGTDTVLSLSADSIFVADVRLNFGGINFASSITTTTLSLNWTANASATAYELFSVAGDGSLTLLQTIAGGGTNTVALTGLAPNTSYTYRINALDAIGNLDSSAVNANVTTKTTGSFTALANLSTTENVTVQSVALACSDTYGTTPVYSIASQSNADANCSISGGKVSCTPNYETAHATWTSTITAQCTLNGTALTQAFTLTVNDTNRAPVLSNSMASQTVAAKTAITSVDVNDTTHNNDFDADLDTILYSCKFSSSDSSYTNAACSSLPNTSYSFNTATGVLAWTPSYAAALSSNVTYTFTITGSDQQASPQTATTSFTVTVTPSNKLVLSGTSPTTAGTCTQLTITLQDVNSNPVNALSPGLTVTIAGLGSAALYTSNTCGTPLVNPIIPAASSSANFWFADTLAENLTFTANAGTLVQGTLAFSNTNNVADHLAIIAGNNLTPNVSASLASNLKVQAQDRYNNPVSGVNLSFLEPRGNGQVASSFITTDASGYASSAFYASGTDLVNKIQVRRVASALPDLAATGNSTVTFTETSKNSNTGIFTQSYVTGTNPTGIATGLFNGDAYPDIVTMNYTTNNISVYINKGNGTFASAVNYALGSTGYMVATGKLTTNSNQRVSIVTTNYGINSVGVFIGNGDGTFNAKVNYAVGTTPLDVKIADFNGDGKQDLVVGNYGATNVSVLLGNGDGTFNAAVNYTVGTTPYELAVGDFNADGKMDVAVVNYGSNTVSVLIGNGDGTFKTKVDYATGTGPEGLATGDFNGDGKLDLMVANDGSNTASLFLGNGDGTFQTKTDFGTQIGPRILRTGDFNGDGKLDFVVGCVVSPSKASVFYGKGNGTFQTRVDFNPSGAAATNDAYDLAVADFNQDGKDDVVLSNEATNTATIMFSNGASMIPPAPNLSSTGTVSYFATIGDFNNDGKMDIISADYSSNKISTFLGNGDGTFGTNIDTATTGSNPSGLTIGDFNGDGKLDVAICNYGGTNNYSVLLGNGDGTFTTKQTNTITYSPWKIITADMNGDGYLDLMTISAGSNYLSIALGVGDGTFGASSYYATGSEPYDIKIADINGDGKLDIVVANYLSNNFGVFMGHGDGTFTAQVTYATPTGPTGVAVGDFNGDGKIDIATANAAANSVSVFLNSGTGTYSTYVSYTSSTDPYSIQVADLNNDGNLDLMSVNAVGSTSSFFAGNGTGTFSNQVQTNLPTGCSAETSIFFADFNGDGKADMVTSCTAGSMVGINFGM